MALFYILTEHDAFVILLSLKHWCCSGKTISSRRLGKMPGLWQDTALMLCNSPAGSQRQSY